MSPDAPQLAPQPSRLLIIFSWLVIVGCICLGSLSIAGVIARALDPCSWVGGIMFIGPALLMGSMQYRGTFRHDRNAATGAMVVLCVCGGFLLFAIAMCSGEFLIKEWRLPPLEMLGAAAGLTLLLFPAAWLNMSWSRQLNQARSAVAPLRRRWQLSLQELLIFTAAAGLSLAIIVGTVRHTPAQTGSHVETDNPPLGIPRGATDICWSQYYRGDMRFEFTADEELFRGWVQKYFDSAPRQTRKELSEVASMGAFDIETCDSGRVTVTDGLVFSWNEEDRGVHVVWERPTKRVYFDTHSY